MTTASAATVQTVHASRYVQQLAKHWAHKFEVEFTPERGVIALPFGRCELSADAGKLDILLTGTPEADWDRFETVVADHLKRFAHREDLAFAWSRVS